MDRETLVNHCIRMVIFSVMILVFIILYEAFETYEWSHYFLTITCGLIGGVIGQNVWVLIEPKIFKEEQKENERK